MKCSTHISMTARAATFITSAHWDQSIDPVLLAKAAAFPDQVEAIAVAGVGHYMLGRNLSSLTHFCHTLPAEGGLKGEGYRWRGDKTVLKLNLPDRDVEPTPIGWTKLHPAITEADVADEPLAKLVGEIRGKASLAADEFTWPTAATMLDWAYRKYVETARTTPGREYSHQFRTARLSIFAGLMAHWAGDLGQPFHDNCTLLGGHAEFEGAQDERWANYASRDGGRVLKDAAIDALAAWRDFNPKDFALRLARDNYRSTRALCLYRLWPPRWRKEVDRSVVRTFAATVQLLEKLRRDL